MQAEVIGIDHVYLSVGSMPAAERFYDEVLAGVLGFRKSRFELGGDPHVQYYNRHFGLVIRPARAGAPGHDPRTPGLHHLCLRVEAEADVDHAARGLAARGVAVDPPRYYPQYAPDYYAIFFTDPDGVRLEITNFRRERKERMHHWERS